MMSWFDLHKFADVIFGITLKLYYLLYHPTLYYLSWSDNIEEIKEFF